MVTKHSKRGYKLNELQHNLADSKNTNKEWPWTRNSGQVRKSLTSNFLRKKTAYSKTVCYLFPGEGTTNITAFFRENEQQCGNRLSKCEERSTWIAIVKKAPRACSLPSIEPNYIRTAYDECGDARIAPFRFSNWTEKDEGFKLASRVLTKLQFHEQSSIPRFDSQVSLLSQLSLPILVASRIEDFRVPKSKLPISDS